MDVMAERGIGVTYCNGTLEPLLVSVGTTDDLTLFINGNAMPKHPAVPQLSVNFNLSPGDTYRIESNGSIVHWMENRRHEVLP